MYVACSVDKRHKVLSLCLFQLQGKMNVHSSDGSPGTREENFIYLTYTFYNLGQATLNIPLNLEAV